MDYEWRYVNKRKRWNLTIIEINFLFCLIVKDQLWDDIWSTLWSNLFFFKYDCYKWLLSIYHHFTPNHAATTKINLNHYTWTIFLCFEHRIQFNFQSNKTPDFTFDFKRKKVYRLKTQVVNQVEPREEGKWFILIVRNSIVIFITLHNCGQAKHKSIFNFEFRRIVHKVEHIKSIICCTYTH